MSESSAPIVRRVRAQVHGRFLVAPSDGMPGAVLVGFHGFGESARDSFEQLVALPGLDNWRRVAVEALHPFYTRSGRIVASWMTSQDRELAIEENIAYVRSVLDEVTADLPGTTPLAMLGFSQGTAMAYRAAAHCGFEPAGVVALAGDVPPELAELDGLPFRRVLIARGHDESWYSRQRLEDDRELLERQGVEVELFEFEGGHEWTDSFRREAGRFLERLAAAAGAA